MKSPCSLALLESALAGSLPETAEDALHQHLEECAECSAALEHMAGGPTWCQEAASLLTKDDLDVALPIRDQWSDVDFTVEHLEPSDDVNVLGRLGGYEVLEVIGHGGMGVVLKAFDRELKRCVAIKVLAPHLAQSALAKKRFAREAQAAAAIVHPNVLAIHQVQPSGRLPFLVMPLVAGESLAERLAAQGTLELKEILRIGIQAAAGLAAAHDQGLVHRDVKPANILLDKGVERAFLTDFGLARAADDATLTRCGTVAGTPQYMSPEQVRGEPLDGRSDLFSLGCVLYEMATGVSPFRADSLVATMRRLVDDSPQAMGSLNPELPPWFIAIVDRLLQKDPSRRFNSAKEVSELLEQCLAHVQQPASVPLPAGLAGPDRLRRLPNIGIKGILAMISALGIGLFGCLLVVTQPPEIAGQWKSEQWEDVVLKKTADGEYTGTFSDTQETTPGEIHLTWSRGERRFNGTWRVGEGRFGEISLRLVGNEIRGAYTSDPKSKTDPDAPRLADLVWTSVPQPLGKDEPRVPPAATFGFERDAVQLVSTPFAVWSLSISANDRFLAAGGKGNWNDQNAGCARVWDLAESKVLASYPTPRGICNAILSPDGRRIALTSWSSDVWLREVGGGELMHERFTSHVRVAFSPDGKLLVGATEREQLRTWDGVTGQSLEKANDAHGNPIVTPDGPFRGRTFPSYWVGFSRDGKYLVVCGGKANDPGGIKFAVWSVASRRQLYKKTANVNRIISASISPDGQTLATSGEKSVILWDLATGNRRTEMEDAGGDVCCVRFSPDGSLLASAVDGQGVVTLWNPATGKSVGTLTGHENQVDALAFTHDGKTLATGGSDCSVRLWDVATRQQTSTLQEVPAEPAAEEDSPAILALAYSPDGKSVVTAREDGQVTVYGPALSGLSRSWIAHPESVAAAVAWSPDGQTLATAGSDKLVTLWNPGTGEKIRSLAGHGGWVDAVAFSPDGQTLASGGQDRSIRLWNVADGAERQVLNGHGGTVRSLAFSHNGKLLASAGTDETVRLWDAASGVEQASLAGHQGPVRSVAFSLDDQLLASGGEDQTINVWNVDTHDLRGTLEGHAGGVSSLAFAGQTLVSASWDHTIRTWNADALHLRSKITAGLSEVVAMALSPSGHHLLTADADRTLTLWTSTIAEEQRCGPLGDFQTFPWTAAFSPDGARVAVAAGGFEAETELGLYDVATTVEKFKVTFPDNARGMAFSPAGDLIALGFSLGRLLLVDAATGQEVAELAAPRADGPAIARVRFGHVAFSPDGKLLAAGGYGDTIDVYDVERRQRVKQLKGLADRILSLAFSPDQKFLITCAAGKPAEVWNLETGQRRNSLTPPSEKAGVASVSFSPDGSLVATGSSKDTCSIWNFETGKIVQTLQAHQGIVFESVFSPDGKLLATGGEDGLAKLWDVATGKLVRTYDCQCGKVLSVRFSPDGKSFVTTGRDGPTRLWWVLPSSTK